MPSRFWGLPHQQTRVTAQASGHFWHCSDSLASGHHNVQMQGVTCPCQPISAGMQHRMQHGVQHGMQQCGRQTPSAQRLQLRIQRAACPYVPSALACVPVAALLLHTA